MFCGNCGKELNEAAKFCAGCGAKNGVSEEKTSVSFSDQTISELERITEMKEKGIVTEDEFHKMKKNVLQKNVMGGQSAVAATVMSGGYVDSLKIEDAPTEEQVIFYRKTYLTAGFSFLAWVFVIFGLFHSNIAQGLLDTMGNVSWLLVLGIFLATSFICGKLQFSDKTGLQYLGLGIYIVAYAIIFLPIINFAVEHVCYGDWYSAVDTVFMPALVAVGTIFAALTAMVFLTQKDFSFLKNFVVFGSFLAIGAIVIFSLTEMSMGSWFAIAMIVLMSGTILYETHKIKTEFNTTQYIGAGATLFASFMILLWYFIKLFIDRE